MIQRCGKHQQGACPSWDDLGNTGIRHREAADSWATIPQDEMGHPEARRLDPEDECSSAT